MEPQNSPQPKTVLFRFVLVVILLFAGLAIFYLYRAAKTTPREQNFSSTPVVQAESVPTLPPTTGVILLQSPVDAQLRALQQFDVEVKATSDGKAVVGYDLVLTFDPEEIEVQKATSLVNDFTLYPVKKEKYYSLTATKGVEVKTQSVFNNTPIAKFTLLPKKSGTIRLALTRQLGVEKTQMVDEQSQILSPQVNEITLEVQ
ncbi:hypothetical protein HYW87_01220 [Candidatus Roizmanbacteria bacterium]|nr:hypothetical protein [Candidatus Roizmanbacteria bacterium]